MAYSKARAVKQWLEWKETEEKQLRALGVDEDIIQQLHTYDWAEFNRERQYLQRKMDRPSYLEQIPAQQPEPFVWDVETLLDSIENEQLLALLRTVDKLTLEIVLFKMAGYTSKDIAVKTGLTVNAIDLRLFKLKKKLKDFF